MYVELIHPSSEEWSTLEIIFENSLKDTNASVRVSALKFAESYACALAEKATKDKDSYVSRMVAINSTRNIYNG